MDNKPQTQILADPIIRQEMLRGALASARAITELPESPSCVTTPAPMPRRPRKSGESDNCAVRS